MDREQKAAAIAELTEGLKGADAIFAVDYRGLSVTEAAELRVKLSEADAVFKVVKNRLAKRAAADAGTEGIDDLLVGPTALTLINGDAVIAAKTINDFAKEHEELEYKGGIMDGAALDPDGFQQIARLPGVDVLRGQLVGIAASPLTGLVRGLGSMVSGLAIALGQIAEQGLVSGEAPAEEPAAEAAEETPAEDATEEPAAEAAEETPADDAPAEEAPAEQAEEAAPAEEQPDAAGGDEPAEQEAPAEEAPEAQPAPEAETSTEEAGDSEDAPDEKAEQTDQES